MRRIGIAAGIIGVFVLLVIIALPFVLDANRFKPELEAELSKALGRDVRVGDLKLAILSGSVSAADVTISDDPGFSASSFLRAKSLNVGIELMPLIFSHKVNVTGITIDDPEIALLQSPSGEWNFSTLGTSKTAEKQPASNTTAPSASSGSTLDLSVKSVNISAGRLTLGRTAGNKKTLVLESVRIEVKDIHGRENPPRLHIKNGKGGKDRYVPLAPGMVQQLRQWWRTHQNPRFLFPTREPSFRRRRSRPMLPSERSRARP